VLQLLPPYINCTGASLARMQILKCWESKRESEAKGFHTDPCGPMLLNQVRSKPACCTRLAQHVRIVPTNRWSAQQGRTWLLTLSALENHPGQRRIWPIRL
jgi:hypothetical protein